MGEFPAHVWLFGLTFVRSRDYMCVGDSLSNPPVLPSSVVEDCVVSLAFPRELFASYIDYSALRSVPFFSFGTL